jgi:hypothetical protein
MAEDSISERGRPLVGAKIYGRGGQLGEPCEPQFRRQLRQEPFINKIK